MADSAARYSFKPGAASSHGRILAMAGAWPRTWRILEIGTASGYLGRELRALGFSAVVGVERDAACAAAAAPYYRSHVTADLEVDRLGEDLGVFDVVICADVLEHLRDPGEQLQRLRSQLSADGRVIISLPNAVNWTVRLSVLSGRFTYADRGLLDRTHLRFFTRRTARALIEASGFTIERMEATPIPVGLAAPWLPTAVASAGERAYAIAAGCWPTLLAYQFVVLARKR